MEQWEKYLLNTREKNYNLERLDSVKSNSNKLVYEYVLRSLEILKSKNVDDKTYYYVSEALKWMDVAKAGNSKERRQWKKKGYDLYAHNYGSSDIYKNSNPQYDEIIRILIRTHGLIGQYIRGEVKLSLNKEIYSLIERKLITKEELKKVLIIYNECLISAASKEVFRITFERFSKISQPTNFAKNWTYLKNLSVLPFCITFMCGILPAWVFSDKS